MAVRIKRRLPFSSLITSHYIILMQLLTPSAVAIADRIASAVCTTNFQNSLFFMVI